MGQAKLTPKALEALKQDINSQIEEYCDRGNYSVAAGLVRALATIVEYQIYDVEDDN